MHAALACDAVQSLEIPRYDPHPKMRFTFGPRARMPGMAAAFVHDIEFVASCVAPRAQGNHAAALGAEAAAYGLTEESCEPDVSGAPSGSGKGTQDNVRTAGVDNLGLLTDQRKGTPTAPATPVS